MKHSILLFLLISSMYAKAQHTSDASNKHNGWITTIDFVEILNDHTDEALHYYDHNWKVLRKMAIAKNYIAQYQLLLTPVSEDNKISIILMTSYANQDQYDKREAHFEELIKKKGALNLMNELQPKEFRKIVFSKEEVKHHN